MSFQLFGRRWSILVPLLALLVVIGLCLILALLVWASKPENKAASPSAVFTVIPAPSSTPLALPGVDATSQATPNSQVVNGIGVGMYVKITGTEGDGLRLRSGPGTSAPPRFLGHESEVFQVKDGPREADNYTWWYLVTPMDESRSGWAAAKFLSVVAAPSETTAP
jgi:hypothetical protein